MKLPILAAALVLLAGAATAQTTFNTISNIIETQSHDAGIWFQPSHDIYGNPL